MARVRWPGDPGAHQEVAAEDILFGRLEKGGTVRIGLDKEADKLTFDIVASKSSPREETVEPVDA